MPFVFNYISPTWYESENAVPTWNYTAAHCYGATKILSGDETKLALEDLLINVAFIQL
ncbi:FMN-binding negative transcriptional regulator [Xenorhabdus sp. DI]|nr:FMN-binding negative transcriptional regulator [Xenorhabdus sp. 3]MBD2788624.1 FMN-binding negative transcriptional regulator [Xenorhabdus sp. DI]